jgi:hypothetical protein
MIGERKLSNLEFNTKDVTRLIRLSNSVVPWASNTQQPIQIIQTGYLRDLIVFIQGTPTITGAIASVFTDPLGPFNVINNFQVNSNVQAGIINLSGNGAAYYDMVKFGLEYMGNSPYTTLIPTGDVSGATTPNTYPLLDLTWEEEYQNGAALVAGSSNPLFQVPYLLPLAQQINTLDGQIGIWDLQDPSVQMTLLFTPNTPTAASPFLITASSGGVGTLPYNAVASGTNNIALTTPRTWVQRLMYDPPLDRANDPDFGYVHSIYEEQWNTSPGGSTVLNWKALANSGWITRLVFSIVDSANLPATSAQFTAAYNTRAGVAPTLMGAVNAINLTVGNNAPVYVESIYDFAFRANQELGQELPQGVFYIDFLGRDLTLQNVLDTFTAGNINLQVNLSSALGATSSGKVIRAMLQAVQQ